MIKIDIRSTFGQQAESLRRMSRELQDKAVAMALNKATAKGKTEMTRAITSEFNIKAGDVRQKLNVRKASAKGLRLVSQLQAFASRRKGRSLNMIHFVNGKVSIASARKRIAAGEGGRHALRNGGYSAHALELMFKIKKRGGSKQIKGAFIGNKGRTVFIREGKERVPIRGMQTIDVPQMFNTRRINERVVQRIEKEFGVEFDRAVRLLLRGGK